MDLRLLPLARFESNLRANVFLNVSQWQMCARVGEISFCLNSTRERIQGGKELPRWVVLHGLQGLQTLRDLVYKLLLQVERIPLPL